MTRVQQERPRFGRSWVLLGLALLWSCVAVAVLLKYHLSEPIGVTSITTNGHTYVGDPPALTLDQRDPVSFAVIATTMGVGLVVGMVDLIVRSVSRESRIGYGAIIAGALVLLVSLFGLLLGLLGVGAVGAFLILSGLPHRQGRIW